MFDKWGWIRDFLRDNGKTQEDLAKVLGWQQTRISELVNNKKDLPKNKLLDAANFFNIDLATLTKYNDGRITNLDKVEQTDNLVSIDILNVAACCGKGVENFAENVVGQQLMTLSALHELTTVSHKNIKILKTTGDSMLPTISPNDSLWVDISCKSFVGDSLYLLCVHNSLMVKRLQYNLSDNSITVKSDNPGYNDNNIKDIYSLEIVGKVIYHIKKVG